MERQLVSKGEYKLAGIYIDEGTVVEVSAQAVHHDPEYYPEPFAFKPERFLPENKSKLVPYTYLPFGQGPRNCVGMRFAYQEMKLLLAKLIRRYRFSNSPNTPTKLSFNPGSLLLNVKPFPLICNKR